MSFMPKPSEYLISWVQYAHCFTRVMRFRMSCSTSLPTASDFRATSCSRFWGDRSASCIAREYAEELSCRSGAPARRVATSTCRLRISRRWPASCLALVSMQPVAAARLWLQDSTCSGESSRVSQPNPGRKTPRADASAWTPTSSTSTWQSTQNGRERVNTSAADEGAAHPPQLDEDPLHAHRRLDHPRQVALVRVR